MAFDAFLKIQTISGDSVQKGFADWIMIESFSWGEERPPSGAGVAVPLEVQLVGHVQSSSPSLFEACASGENLGTMQFHVSTVSGGEAPTTFIKWDLENAVIGSYRIAGNVADETPADQFSIKFTALTYSFTERDAKGAGNTITKSVVFE